MPHFRPRPTARAQELRNTATDAEPKLWRHLSRSQLGHKFSRQMPVGPFICDFMCRASGLVIELDGGQHAENPNDATRSRFIESQGYRVIRFWNNDVMQNLEGVLIRIAETLNLPPPPTPSRMREGKSGEAAKGWASPVSLRKGEEP